MRYADRVKADPSRSVVADMREENEAHFSVDGGGGRGRVMTGRHKVILVAVRRWRSLVMMYGVIPWEDLGVGLPTLWWWFPEMTASFILFCDHHRRHRPDARGRADRRRSSTAPATCSASR